MAESDDDQFVVSPELMLEHITMHARLSGSETGSEQLSDRVMEAMAAIPRHEFVSEELRPFAYADQPLPIAQGKTISQPFIVALMTHLLDIDAEDEVLELGTGSGYHTAVLARLARKVYSVEIIQELSEEAGARLSAMGCANVELRVGDGSQGWSEHAPFDRILVASAPELIPSRLLLQLKPLGRMVVPAGVEGSQQLMLVEKDAGGSVQTRDLIPVAFAPMVVTH